MSTPSIALIPSGYKESKLYSQLPINGDGDLDFARTTIANRVNEQGVIEEMGVNVPRLDYSEGGCPPVLLEPQSTNLIEYSEDFSQAYWNLAGGNIISGQASPNGDNSAFKIQFDGSGTGVFLRTANITLNADTTYTASWDIKNIDLDDNAIFRIELISGGGIGGVNINVNNDYNTISSTDFTRYSITITTGDAVGVYKIRVMGGTSLNASNSFVIANAQLEELPYATSYIPTNGTIETRTQDSASKTGLSSYINSSEGVLYFEGSALVNGGVNRYISLSDGTSDNRLQIIYTTTSNRITISGNSDGNSFQQINYNNIIQTDNNKIAVCFSSSGLKLYVNGVIVDSTNDNTSFINNTLSLVSFALYNKTSLPFQGKVKDLRVYNEALTDQELTELTTI